MRLTLSVEPGLYAVHRGDAGSVATPSRPAEDSALRVHFSGAGEFGGVCPEEEVPPGSRVEGGWRWLRVHGPLPFTAIGVLARLSAPLAAAEISIFVVSSFDTDHLLVADDRLPDAIAALRAADFEVIAG